MILPLDEGGKSIWAPGIDSIFKHTMVDAVLHKIASFLSSPTASTSSQSQNLLQDTKNIIAFQAAEEAKALLSGYLQSMIDRNSYSTLNTN